MRYTVIYEQGPRNWSAYVPDLPVCIAAAKTRRGTERLIKGAVKMYIEALLEDGEPIPQPGAWTGTVEVAVPGTEAGAPVSSVRPARSQRRTVSA